MLSGWLGCNFCTIYVQPNGGGTYTVQLDVDVSPPAIILSVWLTSLCCYQLFAFVNTRKLCGFLKAKGFTMFLWKCLITDRQTDGQKAMHMSPPCRLHSWAQKTVSRTKETIFKITPKESHFSQFTILGSVPIKAQYQCWSKNVRILMLFWKKWAIPDNRKNVHL